MEAKEREVEECRRKNAELISQQQLFSKNQEDLERAIMTQAT